MSATQNSKSGTAARRPSQLLFQKFSLPVHQFRRVLVEIVRQIAERRLAGDESRVDAELVRVRVADFFQFTKTAELRLARATDFIP